MEPHTDLENAKENIASNGGLLSVSFVIFFPQTYTTT